MMSSPPVPICRAAILAVFVTVMAAAGQTGSKDAAHAKADTPLSDYAGVYDYRGTTVALVPKGNALIAIIDDALYPVQRISGDRFRNGAGQSVTFQRNAKGVVTGLYEAQDFLAIRRHSVPPEIAALTVAAPRSRAHSRYRYHPPEDTHDGLKTGNAADVGFDPAVLEQVDRAVVTERYPNVHSVLLWRDGKLFFEDYFYGFDRERAHQLRSATKSFHSALIGIAMDLGKIRDDSQPIVELLPWAVTSYKNPDPRKARITVGDLLSMRTGLACDDRNPSSPAGETFLYEKADWARYLMDVPMTADPGTLARYCSAGPHLAGRIVEHVTGERLIDFARKKLFEPLGFRNYRWPYETVPANAGTFGQLYLRPRDMLKFGVMMLNKGEWNGKRILSRDWVERSTRARTQIGSKKYGYFWWHQTFPIERGGKVEYVDTILATGNGGQKIFIAPTLRLVGVFTGGNYNSAEDTPPNAIMGNVVLPALLGGAGK